MASVQRELLGVGWLAAEVLARGNTRGHAGTRGDAWGRVGTRGDAWGRVGTRGDAWGRVGKRTWGHAGARGGDVVTRGHQHEVSMGTLCVFFSQSGCLLFLCTPVAKTHSRPVDPASTPPSAARGEHFFIVGNFAQRTKKQTTTTRFAHEQTHQKAHTQTCGLKKDGKSPQRDCVAR